jgi:hypothetical protein
MSIRTLLARSTPIKALGRKIGRSFTSTVQNLALLWQGAQ